ncbi:MAG: hypothetical protein GTO14_14730 [Anaerolineales bacterium]|nr:hypothetical protein [Anaerolineales bacterium]
MNQDRIEEFSLNMFNDNEHITKAFGMHISFTEDGSTVVEFVHFPYLNHAPEGIHGGVLSTRSDSVGCSTAAAVHDVYCCLAALEST